MMRLIFYHVPQSTSNLTEAVLSELGIEYDRVEMSIDNGDTRKPEFLSLNPNGRVPVIVHDGAAIWESAAITMYLGEVFGVERGLYPALGPKRGQAMMWIVWGNTALADAAGRLSASLPDGVPGATMPTSRDWALSEGRPALAHATALADLANCFAVVDQALGQQPFLLESYSLVDTHLWALAGWVSSMNFDFTDYPSVNRWLLQCSKRTTLSLL